VLTPAAEINFIPPPSHDSKSGTVTDHKVEILNNLFNFITQRRCLVNLTLLSAQCNSTFNDGSLAIPPYLPRLSPSFPSPQLTAVFNKKAFDSRKE
jgi:hypothetical protein